MITSKSSKKGLTMIILKQRFLNDGTKGLKKLSNDDTKKFKTVP